MAAGAIDLNDAGILVVGEDGAARGTASPGYALFDGNRLLIGEDALEQARLKPRFVHNRFWRDLGTEPLGRPFPREATPADAAHAHLAAVWRGAGAGIDRVLLVVPGSFSELQLGLVLGIARACSIPVVGMVDAAVAAAVDHQARRLLHLDLQLHQAVLTEIEGGDELIRGALDIGPGLGLAGLEELWARRVAATFVRRTRFDPLHGGQSEQTLYVKLWHWLDELSRAEATLAVLRSGDRELTVELTRAELVAAVDERYRQLLELVRRVKRPGEPVTLLVTGRAARLPGLLPLLGDLTDVALTDLDPRAAATGALARRPSIESDGESLPFVTRLPAGPAAPAPAPRTRLATPAAPPARDTREVPTHLVHEGRAHRLDERPLVLGVAPAEGSRGIRLRGPTAGVSRSHCTLVRRGGAVYVEDHSTHGSFLNGDRIAGPVALSAGDRLRVGSPGIELQLIVVEDGER